VQQYGPPAEVFHRPANTFVASFIGSPPMNLLPMTIQRDDGQAALVAGSLRYTPSTPRLQRLLTQAPRPNVVLGVRHTAIPLAHGVNGGGGTLTGEIYTIEPTGDVTYVHVRLGEHRIIASTPDVNYNAPVGAPVVLTLDEEQVHIFDAETTQSLGHV
jgi:multiple sugar transport system ATP-binding protein